MSSPAPIAFGKYTLVDKLGRGGMAEVWRAKLGGPGGFQRDLVVKRILPALADDERFVHMFSKEARLLARLNHPNIVQVHEFGEIDGRYYLAMELVEGHDVAWLLGSLCERGLPPLGFGPLVVRDVCRALAYAHALTDDTGHALRLIHRDISPSNVMVDFHGGIKLLDFGVAKALAESTKTGTQAGVLKGKLWYMAPERLQDAAFDHRVDLFAAGAVLYEAVSGRRLLTGDTPHKVFAQLERAQPPSHARHDVPPELDRICMKALAMSPDERYQSADEMAHDLDACVRQLGFDHEALMRLVRAQPLDGRGEEVTAGRTDTVEELAPTHPRSDAMTAPDSAAAEPLDAAEATVLARRTPSSPAPITVPGRKPPAADDEEEDGETATRRRLRPASSSSPSAAPSPAAWSLSLRWPPSPLVLLVIAIGTAAGLLLLRWVF